MQTVVETPSFLAAAKEAGISDSVRAQVVTAVARNPTAGDLIQRTHGLRKLRHARPGGGKSGGFRIVTYYHSPALPVFLITAFGKNQRSDLTKAEANALGAMVKAMAEAYRKRTRR